MKARRRMLPRGPVARRDGRGSSRFRSCASSPTGCAAWTAGS